MSDTGLASRVKLNSNSSSESDDAAATARERTVEKYNEKTAGWLGAL